MQDDASQWVIRIADYARDPVDDAAYGIIFDVTGPNNFVEMIRVSFSENFIKIYFKVPWFKDLAEEDERILKKCRDLFVRWALVKLETWLLAGANDAERHLLVTDEPKVLEWAAAIEEGKIKPKSVRQSGQDYRLPAA